jgi:hypothetical protein
MNSVEGGEYVFVCVECRERLVVNESMKDELVEQGCVICGASVTPDAFFRNPTSGSP